MHMDSQFEGLQQYPHLKTLQTCAFNDVANVHLMMWQIRRKASIQIASRAEIFNIATMNFSYTIITL